MSQGNPLRCTPVHTPHSFTHGTCSLHQFWFIYQLGQNTIIKMSNSMVNTPIHHMGKKSFLVNLTLFLTWVYARSHTSETWVQDQMKWRQQRDTIIKQENVWIYHHIHISVTHAFEIALGATMEWTRNVTIYCKKEMLEFKRFVSTKMYKYMHYKCILLCPWHRYEYNFLKRTRLS